MLEILVAVLLVIILLMLAGVGVAGFLLYRSRQASSVAHGGTTKRIGLSGGNWAKVRTSLTQAMWDALVAAKPANVEATEDGRVIDASGQDVTNLVKDTIARALMLSGVREWSFGPVDDEVLSSEVPLEDQETLAGYFDDVLSRSALWRRVTSGI